MSIFTGRKRPLLESMDDPRDYHSGQANLLLHSAKYVVQGGDVRFVLRPGEELNPQSG